MLGYGEQDKFRVENYNLWFTVNPTYKETRLFQQKTGFLKVQFLTPNS